MYWALLWEVHDLMLERVFTPCLQWLSRRGVSLPGWLRYDIPVVPIVELAGMVGGRGGAQSGLTISGVEQALNIAFSMRGAVAVALVVNSPGGSPVQSHLIYRRVRSLASEKGLPVLAFCEDAAASGGYLLALSADEIYADASSIIGSIGVVSGFFGFDKLLEKIHIDRRLYTAGEKKASLDMFRPEDPKGVECLHSAMQDLYEAFKTVVKDRRGERLQEEDEGALFSGAFWSGKKALELGLIDGIGDIHGVLTERYGADVFLRKVSIDRSWFRYLGRRVGGFLGNVAGVLEERALWSRYGL